MNKRTYLLMAWLLVSVPAQAGTLADRLGIAVETPQKGSAVKRFFKKGVKAVSKWIPGVGAVTGLLEENVEDKVDRIEEKQNTAIDRLRSLAQEALATKRKVEEMYYYKKQAQRNAQEMLRALKASDPKKFLGGLGEDLLGIPLNPAEYVPETEYTKDLKQNLAMDFSLERGLVQHGSFLLQDTRAALAGSKELEEQSAEEFHKAYGKAVAYEGQLECALHAKEQATLKYYRQEIRRLEKEMKVLEKSKGKNGLTMGDALQIEQTLEMKRGVVRELHEKVNQGIREELAMSEEQAAVLLERKRKNDLRALDDYFKDERVRVHRHYGHLWKFW